jgi:hypothetical protein
MPYTLSDATYKRVKQLCDTYPVQQIPTPGKTRSAQTWQLLYVWQAFDPYLYYKAYVVHYNPDGDFYDVVGDDWVWANPTSGALQIGDFVAGQFSGYNIGSGINQGNCFDDKRPIYTIPSAEPCFQGCCVHVNSQAMSGSFGQFLQLDDGSGFWDGTRQTGDGYTLQQYDTQIGTAYPFYQPAVSTTNIFLPFTGYYQINSFLCIPAPNVTSVPYTQVWSYAIGDTFGGDYVSYAQTLTSGGVCKMSASNVFFGNSGATMTDSTHFPTYSTYSSYVCMQFGPFTGTIPYGNTMAGFGGMIQLTYLGKSCAIQSIGSGSGGQVITPPIPEE